MFELSKQWPINSMILGDFVILKQTQWNTKSANSIQ